MPFKKGESGNPNGRRSGSENKETKKLRQFLADVLDNNQQRFEQELLALESKDFIAAYSNLLEYCTPKLQRTELTGDKENPVQAVFKVAGQEIPFDKK